MTSKEIIKELRKEIDKILQTGKSLRSYRIYQYLDMLEKDNSTLSECIKEWNENGFDVEVYALEIVLHNCYSINKKEDEIEFNINLLTKQISMDNGCYAKLDFKIYHLLSKTLKALEEMKDGN